MPIYTAVLKFEFEAEDPGEADGIVDAIGLAASDTSINPCLWSRVSLDDDTGEEAKPTVPLPIVALVLDNEGKAIWDYASQNMPDFTWLFINPSDEEESLEAIEMVEPLATDPQFRAWLQEQKELLAYTEADDCEEKHDDAEDIGAS